MPRGYKKGQSGNPKGRPKGSIDYRRVDARRTMVAFKFDPIKELIKRYKDPRLSERTHNLCLVELARRWAPVLKSVEVVGMENADKGQQQVQINIMSPVETSSAVDATVIEPTAVTHDISATVSMNDILRRSAVRDSVHDELFNDDD